MASIAGTNKYKASFTYSKVEDAISKFKTDDKKQKEYKSYVKKIPIMILTNGLASTFAFIYSKKGKNEAYKLIYEQTEEWLKKRGYKKDKGKELAKFFIDLEPMKYRMNTNEVLTLFSWLKRFAEGMIKVEGENDGTKEE